MKVLAIQASANKDGLTSSLAQAALEGAKSAGAKIELVHLNGMEINSCKVCGDGWGKCRTDGLCIQDDQFQILRDTISEADALVFAVPVYFHDISETAKSFLDRWRRCEWPHEDKSVLKAKPVIGIAAAGGSGGGAVKALQSLENYFIWLRLSVFDLVPATRFNKEWRLEGLKAAGRALSEGGR
ncbi:MAG: flavodoxin family protein [Armatimonadota bacterium]|nr:flavodoxin family protein [Armatimonadota bacterium]